MTNAITIKTANLFNQTGSANKFYNAYLTVLNGLYTLVTEWGRIGNNPQSQTKNFDSKIAAIEAFNDKVSTKMNRGYTCEFEDQDEPAANITITKRFRNGYSHREYYKKPRLYVTDNFTKKETVFENLMNRRNRPHLAWKKLIMPQLKSLMNEVSLDAVNPKLSWSQKAGCQCGCSPAFILSDPFNPNASYGFDLFVTIK
jgi:predicted DNA-binding WGR domain protein